MRRLMVRLISIKKTPKYNTKYKSLYLLCGQFWKDMEEMLVYFMFMFIITQASNISVNLFPG